MADFSNLALLARRARDMTDANSDKIAMAEPTLSDYYYPGFATLIVPTNGAIINVLVGGAGPAVLLLHGYPQNRLAWRKIAPLLTTRFTVVVPDLRGYGDSSKPEGGKRHINYAKRAMALDQVEVMQHLGFSQFVVVGHDRGARVAQRLALDHAHRVKRLFVIDTIPTDYSYRTANKLFGTFYWHWFFLIQDPPFPEEVLGSNIEIFLKKTLGADVARFIEPDVYSDYVRCFSDPHTLHAVCEDYRAGATIDLEHAAADAGTKITCPTAIAWGSKALIGKAYDPIEVWRKYAMNVSGIELDCGHWAPEEAPEQIIRWILSNTSY
jgi:haloacetate dehalogenase